MAEVLQRRNNLPDWPPHGTQQDSNKRVSGWGGLQVLACAATLATQAARGECHGRGGEAVALFTIAIQGEKGARLQRMPGWQCNSAAASAPEVWAAISTEHLTEYWEFR